MHWVWLLACGAPPDDATLYQQALAAADPVPFCEQIGDPELAGECLAYAARDVAAEDAAAAGRACTAIESAAWQDECWFLVSDTARLTGAEAWLTCDRAGQFEDRCRSHAISRMARRIAQEHPVGEETELVDDLTQLYQRSDQYQGEQARRAAEWTAARTLVRRRKAGTLRDAHLGEASTRLRLLTLRQVLRSQAPGSLRQQCRRPAAEVFGEPPPWGPTLDDEVAPAWSSLCAIVSGQRVDPYAQVRKECAPSCVPTK